MDQQNTKERKLRDARGTGSQEENGPESGIVLWEGKAIPIEERLQGRMLWEEEVGQGRETTRNIPPGMFHLASPFEQVIVASIYLRTKSVLSSCTSMVSCNPHNHPKRRYCLCFIEKGKD